MPKIRGGGYISNVIPRYKQRVDEVDAALMKISLYETSTTLTAEALKPLLGESVSVEMI